jgi:ethanolamine-phosphate cytidylyltransferase
MNAEYLDWLIKEYDIDFVVHGDDPCLDEHGNDVYAAAKARGKYREIKRTEGVSTTDIVGRMLSLTKHHHTHEDETVRPPESISSHYSELAESEDGFAHSFTRVSSFLPTSSRIMQFSSGRTPKKNDRIGYVSGVWDMCGPGHVQFLKEARKHCDFLLVGVHRDDTANYHRGGNFPILNLHERALGVLCLRYTDEIILGAPWVVSKDLMTTMNITVCITGTKTDSAPLRDDEVDPYELPRSMGKLVVISSPSSLSTEGIVDRVVKDREQYQKKFDAKHKKEQVYLDHKSYVPEVTK